MLRFLARAIFAGLGLWLSSKLVHGVQVADLKSLVAATVLLAVANAIVRPIAIFLTLPLTIVTLGLFLLVLNGLMIWMVAALLDGFNVSGLLPAILAGIVTGAVSWFGHLVIGHGATKRS